MTQISRPTTSASFHDGDYMLSPNSLCKLTYRNGSFSLNWNTAPYNLIWSSPGGGTPGIVAKFRDGLLSVPNIWDSGTGGNPGATLDVTDAGHVTITSLGVVIWDNGSLVPAHFVRLLRDLPAVRASNPSVLPGPQGVLSTVKSWLADAHQVLGALEAQLAQSGSPQLASAAYDNKGNGNGAGYSQVVSPEVTP
jgi:hypothetical protein